MREKATLICWFAGAFVAGYFGAMALDHAFGMSLCRVLG